MGTLSPSLPHRNSWPVGFRFQPTDEELINHYLKNKMLANESHVQYIREVDICKYDPWELPRFSNDESGDQEWFFFCAQDFKYSNGRRSNRATASGYWKSTGKNRKITESGKNKLVIGSKKTLVFYKGRVPNGVRTNWVIHEYRPKLGFAVAKSFVICRLKKKEEGENAALTCDEAGFVNSNFENVTPIQEIPEVYGQSLFLPLQPSDYELHSTLYSNQEPTYSDFQDSDDFGSQVSDLQPSDSELCFPLYSNQEPTYSDFQDSNAFGSQVSDLQPSDSELCSPLYSNQEPTYSDFQDSDDSGSQVSDLQPSDSELYSTLYSNQEPTYSDFQASDDFGSQVFDLQPSDSELCPPLYSNQECTYMDFQASAEFGSQVAILVDGGNDFNAEELLHLVNQNHGGGFSTTTGTNAAFGLQNDDVSQSLFCKHTSSRLQSTSTIKESRRSSLTSKRLKYIEEDLSSVRAHVDSHSDNCISYPSDTDDSDENIKTFRSQRQSQSKSNKLVAHVDAPKIVRSKSVAQREAISHHKEKAAVKHSKGVRLPKVSIADSMIDQKSEVSKCCRAESVKSGRKGSSMILTTKCIHHKSNPPSVYVVKACIGFILFVIVVREVLLYGNWW